MSMVVCKQCGELLNSKHVHDFVQCQCPNETFVDGGNNYFRHGGKDMSLVITSVTEIEAYRLSFPIKKGLV